MPIIITRNSKGSLLTPTEGDDQVAHTTRYLSALVTLSALHNRETLECDGTFAITLPDAATLQGTLKESSSFGDIGFEVAVVNPGSGVITIDLTTAADTLRGVADGTLTLRSQDSVVLGLNTNGGVSDGYFIAASALGSGKFLTNSNGNANISDTGFELIASVTQDSWETIGRTGAGATDTWAALDSVPLGANWIEVRCIIKDASSVDERYISLYARDNAGSQAIGDDNLQIYHRTDNTTASAPQDWMTRAKLRIDDAGILEVYLTVLGAPDTMTLYLDGYGWN